MRQILFRCLTVWIVSLMVTGAPAYAQSQPANVNPEIIMLGDSITYGGPWHALFPNAQILNRGVSGYTTHDLLREMQATTELRPSKVFLMIGINDLLRGALVEETFERYLAILNALQNSGIKVYIQATIECARAQCGVTVDKVRALNEKLRMIARTRGNTFIDLNPELASQTQGLLKKYTTDGLHLSVPAYRYWARQIESYIKS